MTASIPDVSRILCQLGATANYIGSSYLADAILLCMEDPHRLRLITKSVYPEIARRHHTSWGTVERDIRTVIAVIWRRNPALLAKMAGFRLEKKPGAAAFLAILTNYCSGYKSGNAKRR